MKSGFCEIMLLLSIIFLQIQAQENMLYTPIEEQTFFVYRRYYFIARLDRTIKLLAKLYHETSNMQAMFVGKSIDFKNLLPEYECSKLRHNSVKHSIKSIHHTCSLKPLFMVWDSFKSYKALQDDLFVEDFSKEIFIIARNTINHIELCQQSIEFKHPCMQHTITAYILHDLLDDMDVMTQHLSCCLQDHFNINVPLRSADMSDLKLSVSTDEVAFRFYCLKRIEKVVKFLLVRPPEQLVIPDRCYSVFRHAEFGQHIRKRKTFIQLWEDVKQYKYIDDDQFTRDFLKYILMLLHKQNNISRSLSYEDVEAIHNQIEKMPIEEMLNAIDSLMTNINQIHQHYQKSGLTFTQWFKRYWWVPPIVFSSFLFKAIQHYYTHA